MIRSALFVTACSMILGAAGCGMMGGHSTTQPSTMPMSSSNQSMMDEAKAMLKKGEDLLAKGKADNNTDEQTQGQSMIDQAKAMIEKYKNM